MVKFLFAIPALVAFAFGAYIAATSLWNLVLDWWSFRRTWKWQDLLCKDGSYAIGGVAVVSTAVRLLIGSLAVLAVLSFATPAHAVIACDQYLGCREVGAQKPIVTKAKIERAIKSRPNVRITRSGARIAVVKSGLGDDFGVFTQPVVSKLQKAGYQVERRPWWWPESDSRRVALAVGHSLGGSAVLTCPDGTCDKVVSIDPPRMNPGCRGGHCDNYYSRFNPIGGGSVRGARNHAIPPGHLRAPYYAQRYIN